MALVAIAAGVAIGLSLGALVVGGSILNVPLWTAARFLAGCGIDARSVAGGTGAWLARGLPVVAREKGNVA